MRWSRRVRPVCRSCRESRALPRARSLLRTGAFWREPCLSGELAHEVAELGKQQPGHAEADGVFRPGECDDDFALNSTGARPAEHCRRADFLIAQHPEELAKSFEPLFEKITDDFVGGIA